MMVTVCHYCQEVFEEYSVQGKPEIINLADIIHDRIIF